MSGDGSSTDQWIDGWRGLDLRGANLRGHDFTLHDLRQCDFTDADLTDAILYRANCEVAKFVRCKLVRVAGTCCDMAYADLSDADLTGAEFGRSDFRWAKTDGWITTWCDLSGATWLQGDEGMAYADLTAEQKASVQAMCQLVRPLSGELGRLLEKFQAVVSYYSGNVETILGELQSSDLVPNESGYAGAQSMTKAELVNLVGYFITLCATPDGSSGSYNTNYHRALYAKAAGPMNLLNG